MDLIEQLNHIFYPRAIAVVGASDNSKKVGFMCVKSLLEAGFSGKIYPVNPDLSELFGLKVYPSVTAIPGEVDLAIIAIPAQLTIPVVEDCVAKGVKGTIMFTSGFKELGSQIGLELQDRIRDVAEKGGMKIVGPNCLGVVNPQVNLNATFGVELGLINPGSVAVAAQSGAVSQYIADALTGNNVGISKFISMGNRCNLYFDEMLEYLAQDEQTRVIVMYIEGLERPRQFMSVAKQVARRKPIVVYKAGRNEKLNQASLSHTGALAGNYEFYKALFTQTGIIAVNGMTELVDVTKALAFQPPSSGNRVAVLSGGAGPGIVMADKCHELGLRLAEFSPATLRQLRQLISPLNPVDNPVDLAWVSGNFDACRQVLKVVIEDDNVDMLAIAGAYIYRQLGLMRAVVDISGCYRKPLAFACLYTLVGEDDAEIAKLEENSVPVYPLPDRVVTGLAGLFKYGKILNATD